MSRGASRFPSRRNACLSLPSPAAGRFSALSLARRAASWDRQADLAAFDRSGPFVDGVAGLRIRTAPRPYAASVRTGVYRQPQCGMSLPRRSYSLSQRQASHAFRSERSAGSVVRVPSATKRRERLRDFLIGAQVSAGAGYEPFGRTLGSALPQGLGPPMRLGSNPSPSQGFATCTNRP